LLLLSAFVVRDFSNREETVRETDSTTDAKLVLRIRKSDFLSVVPSTSLSRTPRLPSTTGSGSTRRLLLLSHPVLYRLVSFHIHNECRASQLYRVCGRANRFPRTTLVPNPFQPFGSLFSDSKPADLQLSSFLPET